MATYNNHPLFADDETPETAAATTDVISNGRVDAQAVLTSLDAIYQVESMPSVAIVRNGQSRDVPGTLAAQLMNMANRSGMTFSLTGSTVIFA